VDSIIVENEKKPDYEPIPAGTPFILNEEEEIINFDNSEVELREKKDSAFVLTKPDMVGSIKLKLTALILGLSGLKMSGRRSLILLQLRIL